MRVSTATSQCTRSSPKVGIRCLQIRTGSALTLCSIERRGRRVPACAACPETEGFPDTRARIPEVPCTQSLPGALGVRKRLRQSTSRPGVVSAAFGTIAGMARCLSALDGRPGAARSRGTGSTRSTIPVRRSGVAESWSSVGVAGSCGAACPVWSWGGVGVAVAARGSRAAR
jgi:hypothetical protein